MAALATVTGVVLIICLGGTSAQNLGINITENQGICGTARAYNYRTLEKLRDCIVVLGDIRIYNMGKHNNHFSGISFPKLREVTGFFEIRHVKGLESLGQLFPNLARIRGVQLFNNYGLVVHDLFDLKEIGLYNFLKLDRGGVTISGGSHTCHVLTVNWTAISPRSRNVLIPPDRLTHCDQHCNCSTNYCWNSSKCQRFLDGPNRERCNEQCLGCQGRPDECSVCRHYTFRGRCLSECPDDTIILPLNKYCLTENECRNLKGWSWNNTCVFECPTDYTKSIDTGVETCKRCFNCQKTCKGRHVTSLNGVQQLGGCVYINGSLTIRIGAAVPEAMEELRIHLSRIQVVTDFVEIYSSMTITALDFLPSLRRIEGKHLKNDIYSLIIYNMLNIKELFTPKVTENLEIGSGKLKMHGNPKLCMSRIAEIRPMFPIPSNETDIPKGMNGYSGGCVDKAINLNINVLNETAATVIFTPFKDPNVDYIILYVRLPTETHRSFVPETCCESEWFAVNDPIIRHGKVELTSLRPASTYAVCIEAYSNSNDPTHTRLERSTIANFHTHVGKPEPPFILELVAFSSDTVDIRWVNHNEYQNHITSYELDVLLIEIYQKHVKERDHCYTAEEILDEKDYSRHALIFKPPEEYERGCEPKCGVISTVPKGIEEEHFDICGSLDKDCDIYEEERPKNSSFGSYVRTLVTDIKGPMNSFRLVSLAPFRDYKFKLRACAGKKCSRSSRAVVRTRRAKDADIPSVTYVSANMSGYISIKWNPPNITNGPVLTYTVQVMPHFSQSSNNVSQTWCVSSDKLSLVLKSQIVSEYLVSVCSTTLGSMNVCSSWQKVYVPSLVREIDSAHWAGIFFGISLTVVSIVIGFLWQWRSCGNVAPLIERELSSENENETTSTLVMNEVVQSYSVPILGTLSEYIDE